VTLTNSQCYSRYPKARLNQNMRSALHESRTVRTASVIIRLSHMVAGDPESVGVLAQLATVDDTALSQVLASQYRGLLPVVVVQTGACTQRMNQVLQQAHLPLPDILSLSHSQPYRSEARHHGSMVATSEHSNQLCCCCCCC